MSQWAADFASRVVVFPASSGRPPLTITCRVLTQAGYMGVLRYILGDGKAITEDEFADLTSTPGFALALVMESTAQAAQGGFDVGRAEAQAAFARADRLGWPSTSPIYFVGEDPSPEASSHWDAIEAYFRGVGSVVPVSRIGDYGSAAQIDHIMSLGLTTYGWAVETWPGDPVNCHIRQMANPVPGGPDTFSGGVDRDMILKPDWGQWSATTMGGKARFGMLTDFGGEDMIVTDQFRANQLDTFQVDDAGRLVHFWFPTGGSWIGEVLATGGKPGGRLTIETKWAGDGMFHVFTERAGGGQVHRFWNGEHWGGDEQAPPP
jgi:hypothetical protein